MSTTPNTPEPEFIGMPDGPREEVRPPTRGAGKPAPSRRAFFGASGASALAGLAVGAAAGLGGAQAAQANAQAAPGEAARTFDFYGTHQAGVATPPQDNLVFTSFDITAASAQQLQVLLATLTSAMSQLCSGKPLGQIQPDRPNAVPSDTGEAEDLGPNGLTLTLGFGPGLFDERFGLAKHKPKLLADLPPMAGDALTGDFTGGDLCIQACAYDPQVAYHAVRNLARVARTALKTRWTVLGFGRASAGANQSTPRNLMGFKDGTRNITSPQVMDEHVWVSDADQPWMEGGSFLVARKIHMLIETWDTDYIADQNDVFGRNKGSGAPLTGTAEFDTPDFSAKAADGKPVIPTNSHIALAARENNGGTQILRRSYNFTDGLDAVGRLDAGLFFISYQKDPAQFVKLQSKLGANDRLNEYIRHVGSAVFAVPRGLKDSSSYYGQEFFA